MNKILFIGEGEKAEKKFCNLIIEKYFLHKKEQKEFVSFGTNIHALYDEMKSDEFDIIELIKERAIINKDKNTFEKLDKGGFAEVYLIFDFDPQAQQYNCEKLIEMINYFDNETEHGKLYINYPMLESLRHFMSIPDSNYNSYCVSKSECLTYKAFINGNCILKNFSSIDKIKLKNIVKQNIEKISLLLDINISEYDLYLDEFKQSDLLNFQMSELNIFDKIWIINTSVFFGIDYYGKKLYDEYML